MYKLQLFSVLFHNNHICYHATSPLAFPACARTCVWNRLALGPTDVCVLCSSPCWLHVSETGAAVQKYCKSLSERKLFICSFMLFKICFYVIAQRTLLSFISCTLKKKKKKNYIELFRTEINMSVYKFLFYQIGMKAELQLASCLFSAVFFVSGLRLRSVGSSCFKARAAVSGPQSCRSQCQYKCWRKQHCPAGDPTRQEADKGWAG